MDLKLKDKNIKYINLQIYKKHKYNEKKNIQILY